MEVTNKLIENDISKLKSFTEKSLNNKKYEEFLKLVSCLSNLLYSLNYKYMDQDLERYLVQASDRLITNTTISMKKNRWVLYDTFGLDGKGLTQQYISALIEWNVEFLYILELNYDITLSKNILQQVSNYEKGSVYINDSKQNGLTQLSNIKKVIDDYSPEKAFLHLAPWSSMSIILWNSYRNIIKRYFINLTDHAFWIGVNSADIFIEFREYGYFLSNKFRNIDKSKLIIQKYYPISLSNIKLQDLPISIDKKKIIFSGGAYYKMIGFSNMYFQAIKSILLANNNAILFIAGSGDDTFLNQFINNNKFEKRIFLLGHRKDINAIMKITDLYINTFPIGGGLMMQYALINNVPVISYASTELTFSDIETLYSNKDFKISFYDIESLVYEATMLLQNQEYNKIRRIKIKKNKFIISKIKFASELYNKIYNKDINLDRKIEFNQNQNSIQKLYLDNENNFFKEYNIIKFKWLGLNYFKYDFFNALLALADLFKYRKQIVNKIKRIFNV